MSAFLPQWASVMETVMLSGSLTVAGIWLLLRVLPRGFTELRAWLWWMAGVKFLLGLFFVIPISVPAAPTVVLPTKVSIPPGAIPVRDDASAMSAATLTPWYSSSPVVQSLFLVWAIGVLAYVLLFFRQVTTLRSVLRSGEPIEETFAGATVRRMAAKIGLNRPPRIVASDAVSTPLTTNPFRPVIVLPCALLETLTDAEVELTLAHELAHVRRGDLLLAIPLLLAQAAFWFFPPVWFCVRAWDTARESACDEMALAMTGATPAAYGDLLIKVIEADHRQLSLPALGVSSSFHTLRFRLGGLGSFTSPSYTERPIAAVLLFLGICLTLPLQVTAKGGSGSSATNRVQNAGFEAGAETPTGWRHGSLFGVPRTRGVRDTAVKHSGRASLRFTKSGATFFPVAFLEQTLPPVPDGATKMRLRVWVKAKQVRKATVAVHLGNAEGVTTNIVWGAYIGEANDGDKPANHDWKPYETVVSLPTGTRTVTLMPQMYGSGTVWFDDMSASFERSNRKGK